MILFIEPYVPPAEIEKVFKRSGLDRYVVALQRDEPLPTLGALVRRNKRVVVLTEKDADGTIPWYLDGFSFVQDTPLGATKVDQLSCKLERGDADSPFLMLNHWADLFPPRLEANVPFHAERAVARARPPLRARARVAGQPDRDRPLRPGRLPRRYRHPQRASACRPCDTASAWADSVGV